MKLFATTILAALVLATGARTDEKLSPAELEKHVLILMGDTNYKELAKSVKVGDKVKIIGELSMVKGRKQVIVQVGKLQKGSEKAVTSADLTKDFQTDRNAAEKKYKLDKFPRDPIVVEGKVIQMNNSNFQIVLEGNKK
jgi:hypothetical protein